MIEEGLVVFYNTHDAIKADDICMSKGLDAALVSTHPSITLGCGFMLKITWNSLSDILRILDNENIEYRGVYYSQKIGLKREIETLYEKKD